MPKRKNWNSFDEMDYYNGALFSCYKILSLLDRVKPQIVSFYVTETEKNLIMFYKKKRDKLKENPLFLSVTQKLHEILGITQDR